jgi:hypothetical protein
MGVDDSNVRTNNGEQEQTTKSINDHFFLQRAMIRVMCTVAKTALLAKRNVERDGWHSVSQLSCSRRTRRR